MDKNIDYVALGKKIKEKRIERKLTQEQLGEICEERENNQFCLMSKKILFFGIR